MLFRFKSKVTGDTLMLQPHGELLLRLLGREPAGRGILEPADMAQALEALRRAVEEDDRARALEDQDASSPGQTGHASSDADRVSLRRRLWPMVEMIERARAAGEPVVWGV